MAITSTSPIILGGSRPGGNQSWIDILVTSGRRRSTGNANRMAIIKARPQPQGDNDTCHYERLTFPVFTE